MSELYYKCYDTLGRASASISDLRRELKERDAKISRLKEELEVIKGLYDIACDGYLQVKDKLDEARAENATHIASLLEVGDLYGSDNGQIAYGVMLQETFEQKLQQSRKEGWEQCRREAEALISNLPREIYSTRVTSKYIAEMEYKESRHERNIPQMEGNLHL